MRERLAVIDGGWISVTVNLPDDDLCVLIALDDGEVWTGYIDGDGWRYVSGDSMESKVTHWMHVPEHPAVGL
jgi:hypothetical protein